MGPASISLTVRSPAGPHEVEQIVGICTNEKINYAVALLGYRRIGKTTILAKAAEELDSRGVLVVYFDVIKNPRGPGRVPQPTREDCVRRVPQAPGAGGGGAALTSR